MLRTSLTLLLIATQGLLSAPLYVCTSAAGAICLDGGAAVCVACRPRQHEHQCRSCCSGDNESVEQAPCNCRHEPLSIESQEVRRCAAAPSGELLVAPVALPIQTELTGALRWARRNPAVSDSQTPLTELGSVCLRC